MRARVGIPAGWGTLPAPIVAKKGLAIRLLGDVEVLRGEDPLALPPSKKTRALLAYLIVTGRAHRRDRLCSLFWDVADDPRGALRWSLSKLRAVLDERGIQRIAADRENVAFVPEAVTVDVLEARRLLANGPAQVPTEALIELAARFRGELLEGFELSDFDDFQAWCVAEREQFRRLHATLLEALVARLNDEPERALPHARTLARVDPLRAASRTTLLELLIATERREEAEQQYRSALRLFDEAGSKSAGALRATWAELLARRPAEQSVRATAAPEPEAAPPSLSFSRLAGRRAERARLVSALERATAARRGSALLLHGEPGIGKTRLVEELAAGARSRATVLIGAAYEAESGRPYAAWVDALRQLPDGALEDDAPGELTLLLPELGAAPAGEPSRDRLFDAVLALVARLVEAAPLVLVFEDVQWSDESTTALLHYVTRMNRNRPLLVVMTARTGELGDNDAVASLVRSLRRDRLLEELELEPLGAEDTAELLRGMVSGDHVPEIVQQCAGNPLFALELARSLPEHGDAPSRSLTQLVRDRLHRLPAEAADVLRWAAVLGHGVDLGRLTKLSTLPVEELVSSLEKLELHALLRPATAAGSAAHAFAHDVVRRVVYADLSEPRRRMMHLRIARVLSERGDPDEQLAGEIAHHAALGGDAALAARACVAAGRHCVRLFAAAEAHRLARRGLRHAEALDDPERTELSLELMEIEVGARRPDDLESAARRVEQLAEHAEALGSVEHARLGFHVASHLRFEGGQWAGARRSSLRAELVSREGDEGQQAIALAEAGRCLAMLERDLGQAEQLLCDAAERATRLAVEPVAIPAGLGMLRLHQGQHEQAYELLQRALVAARRTRDRGGEFQALEQLVMLELERGRPARASELSLELCAIGEKLRGGSEIPFASALAALCRIAAGDASAQAELEAALRELRLVDAKYRLAYVLTRLASIEAGARRAEAARAHALEALEVARLLDRPSEIVLAHVALARAAAVSGDAAGSERHLEELRRESLHGVSAHAEQAVEHLLAERTTDR